VDPAKAFALKISQRSAQLLRLLSHNMWTESAVRTIAISLVAKILRQIKNNGDRNTVILPGKRNDWLSRLNLHIRSIDYYELARRQSLGGDEIKDIEGIVRSCLAVLVVRHKATAEV
jgi:hypothetical protein